MVKDKPTPKMIPESIWLYWKYGTRHFFKGLAPCLIWAYPVNAVTLVSYDLISSAMLKVN